MARFRQSLRDPGLLKGSIPAALRDEYGADSDVCTDNLIMVIFAGFETSTSLVVGLMYHLAQQQAVLDKVRWGINTRQSRAGSIWAVRARTWASLPGSMSAHPIPVLPCSHRE